MQGAFNIWGSAGRGRFPGAGAIPDSQDEAAPAPRAEVRKVLVVDDERDLADLAEALLCSRGFDVQVAYSAADALRILESDHEMDALFSDVMMPGMNGLELATAVRALYPKVKVVLTSGYTLPALLDEHDRCYLYAAKPYKIETIVKLLRS